MGYELYGTVTPNVGKVTVMLEEAGLDYVFHDVDVTRGEQFAPEFVTLNGNSKVPVLVATADDRYRLVLAESGAILLYLSEAHGVLHEPDLHKRASIYQWLMFQMSAIGPMLGQLRHFMMVAPPGNDHALDRYRAEALRLFSVVENQLSDQDFIAGAYSVADVALYPWFHFIEFYRMQGVDFGLDRERYTAVTRWQSRCLARAAVQRGMHVLEQRIAKAVQQLKDAGKWQTDDGAH